MSVRAFLILCGLTLVVVVAAAFAVIQRERPETAVAAAGKVLPELTDQLAGMATISIATPETELTIVRTSDGWVLEERGNYSVPTDTVRSLVVNLANLEKVEGKTTRPDRYATLGVQDIGAEAARSTQVQLLDSDGSALAELLIGDQTSAGDGVFVRIPGEERAWLARGNLDIGTGVGDWVERQITDVPANDIRRLQVTHGDGETVTLEKDEAGDAYTLVELPEGGKVDDSAALQRMTTVFAGLNLEDVEPAQPRIGDSEAARRIVATTTDGLVLTADIYPIEGASWMTVQAEPADDTAETVPKLAREINDRTLEWIYRVPSWKVASWEKRLAELIADEPPEPADDSPETAN